MNPEYKPTEKENEWIKVGLTIALQLIPDDRVAFIKEKGKKFADSQNVYKHYNTALADTRKAINDYFTSI